VARSAAPPATVGALIRDAIREADRDLPLVNQAPLLELIGVSLLPNRIAALLAGAFGAVGLVLAAVGLYGLLSYAVSRRRREIGIRMALGAAPGDVRRLVLKDGLRLTAIGLVVGLVLAVAVTQLLRRLLFGVSPADPLTLIAIAALLGITAAIACAVPAMRATRTDPMEALRHD
jgi:ABC-type antimicrobial peptide transport system permease subunit